MAAEQAEEGFDLPVEGGERLRAGRTPACKVRLERGQGLLREGSLLVGNEAFPARARGVRHGVVLPAGARPCPVSGRGLPPRIGYMSGV